MGHRPKMPSPKQRFKLWQDIPGSLEEYRRGALMRLAGALSFLAGSLKEPALAEDAEDWIAKELGWALRPPSKGVRIDIAVLQGCVGSLLDQFGIDRTTILEAMRRQHGQFYTGEILKWFPEDFFQTPQP